MKILVKTKKSHGIFFRSCVVIVRESPVFPIVVVIWGQGVIIGVIFVKVQVSTITFFYSCGQNQARKKNKNPHLKLKNLPSKSQNENSINLPNVAFCVTGQNGLNIKIQIPGLLYQFISGLVS